MVVKKVETSPKKKQKATKVKTTKAKTIKAKIVKTTKPKPAKAKPAKAKRIKAKPAKAKLVKAKAKAKAKILNAKAPVISSNPDDALKSVLINKGGLPVLYEKIDYLRSVIVGVWVRVGSRFETPAEEGYAHFVEHMLFKGTKKGKKTRSALDIAHSLESLGGEMNAFTSREYCCYYAKAASHHFSTIMEVLSDITLRSTFPAKEFEKERGVVLEEIRMYEDSPEELSHELLQGAMFSRKLGHPIVGSYKGIENAKRKDVYDYYKKMYKSGRIFLTVLGNVPQDEVEKELSHFAPLARAKAVKSRKQAVPKFKGGNVFVNKQIEQLHLCFGLEGLSMTSEDRFTFHLINTWLGGGMSSRFFQKIREERGLAYSVYSFSSSFGDTGMWGVYCGTNVEKGREVREILDKELADICRTGIDAKTLSELKEQIIGGTVLSLERTSSRMNRLAVAHMFFGEIIPVDDIIAKIRAVTTKDVLRVARSLFSNGFKSIVAVGPINQSQADEIFRD